MPPWVSEAQAHAGGCHTINPAHRTVDIADTAPPHLKPPRLIADRFPTVAISYSIRCINKLIENVNQPDLTPVNALSTALDIERALLENRYFDVFASDGAEVRRVLELLAEGTKAHIEKVQRAWRDSKPTTDHQQSPA